MFVPVRYFATEHDFVCQVVAEDANGKHRVMAMDIAPVEAQHLACVYSALLAFGRLPRDFESWTDAEP